MKCTPGGRRAFAESRRKRRVHLFDFAAPPSCAYIIWLELAARLTSGYGLISDATIWDHLAFCKDWYRLPTQPGYLIVGAADDGRPSGLIVTDDLRQHLAALRFDGNIESLPPSP